MSKYPNRTNKNKAVTINIDLEVSEEDQVKSLIQQGHDLLQTLENVKKDRLERAEAAVSKVKQDIEDLKA